LGGLLGYVAAIGSKYEGDKPESAHDFDIEKIDLSSNSRLFKLRLRQLKISLQMKSGLKYARKSIMRLKTSLKCLNSLSHWTIRWN